MTHALDLPLLADENIHPAVVVALRAGRPHRQRPGARGRARVVLERAVAVGQGALTHDSDFGTLAMRSGAPWIGIVYVRPGHIAPAYVLETLEAVVALELDLTPPFLVVAVRRHEDVRVRARQGSSDPGM